MADLTRDDAVEAMTEAAWNRDAAVDGLPRWEDLIYSEDDQELVAERRADQSAALDALLSLLAERGWQVVPVVATEEMYGVEHSPLLVLGAAGNTRVQQWRSGIYAAMLAAAPAPLSEEGADDK